MWTCCRRNLSGFYFGWSWSVWGRLSWPPFHIYSPRSRLFFSPKASFAYPQSCCTSKHNLKYAISMNPSKRKTLDSHSTQFSQNFTFLRIRWSGLCKISMHLKQTIRSSWVRNVFHILLPIILTLPSKVGIRILADLNKRYISNQTIAERKNIK